MEEFEYYSIETAIKMLPLITKYCRDIRLIHQSVTRLLIHKKNLQRLKPETKLIEVRQNNILSLIEFRIKQKSDRFRAWKQELQHLDTKICQIKMGFLDIPVWDEYSGDVISLCIHEHTTEDSIDYHTIKEDNKNAKPYWV